MLETTNITILNGPLTEVRGLLCEAKFVTIVIVDSGYAHHSNCAHNEIRMTDICPIQDKMFVHSNKIKTENISPANALKTSQTPMHLPAYYTLPLEFGGAIDIHKQE